jgi:Ca-activated chloride channel homolog
MKIERRLFLLTGVSDQSRQHVDQKADLLGFYSTNEKRDGSFRKLSVRIKKPGYHARARTGYYAPKE